MIAEAQGNAALAGELEKFAGLLDLAGASPYASRAYRRAAETLRALDVPVTDLLRTGRLRDLRGIGPGIESRLRELVETGSIAELEELRREVDPELVALGRFIGLSPRRVVDAGRALGIRTADEFRSAAGDGRIRSVPGIGTKGELRILEALDREPRSQRALLLSRARELSDQVALALGGTAAGEARRGRDTCWRLAVVCAAARPEPLLTAFEQLPTILALVERHDRRAVGITVEGAPCELIVAAPDAFGPELIRATGSPEYVQALAPLPSSPTEEGVYAQLGIPWCPPELREAPFRGQPPRLLELADLCGDLHCHTTWSDGRATVLEMGTAARERGYEYLAICDHTPNVRVVPGLDADALRRQAEEIARANEELAPFRVLRGVECDIRADGSLDVPEHLLAQLDWVQLSLHAGQRAPGPELTAKVIEAMRNPHVSALSHPTGRLINHRAPNALDIERVIEVALETGVALEVNGLPNRLDLRDDHVRLVVEAGAKLVVSTDAHSVSGLDNMPLAVATARRGLATAADVLNTLPLAQLLAGQSRTHQAR